MYEAGFTLALLIWLGSLVWLIVSLNSQLERNLNKVGLRLSWISLTPKPMGNNHRQRSFLRKTIKAVLLLTAGFIGVLFSWLYVALYVGSMVYSRAKDAGAPQAIKEFRWRMRNMDLSFDEIVNGLALVSGKEVATDEFKGQIWADLVERGNA